ncbi:hypothetical protein H4R34_003884 [Dimargaris verticillata]|uniref:Calreticulin n=1 Tax=Dimargaris verticillata TaxID=2761393 RepID=A0A9W8B611_9FUNG|nr:hypothetical protein H4R34_003884 [Dimargaris verticillata]
MRWTVTLASLAALLLHQQPLGVNAKVYLEETFDTLDEQRWVASSAKPDFGPWKLNSGSVVADPVKSLGLQTGEDYRFYAISAPLTSLFDTQGKDLVLQYSVRFDQVITCSGAYIKLLPEGFDPHQFNGESPYSIMFGPDLCGSSHEVKALLGYQGKNYQLKKSIAPINDQLTHVYTLVIKPNRTYRILLDGAEKASGHIEDDWDILAPRTMADPNAIQPDDWEDRYTIPDPEYVQPVDYNPGPETIPDPSAKQPDNWDESIQGPWSAPSVPNPDYKPWKPRMIANPNFQGPWTPPIIANPDYIDDPDAFMYRVSHVGFDLWQVTAGVIFDNILVTDDSAYAQEFAQRTVDNLREREKEEKRKLDLAKGLIREALGDENSQPNDATNKIPIDQHRPSPMVIEVNGDEDKANAAGESARNSNQVTDDNENKDDDDEEDEKAELSPEAIKHKAELEEMDREFAQAHKVAQMGSKDSRIKQIQVIGTNDDGSPVFDVSAIHAMLNNSPKEIRQVQENDRVAPTTDDPRAEPSGNLPANKVSSSASLAPSATPRREETAASADHASDDGIAGEDYVAAKRIVENGPKHDEL